MTEHLTWQVGGVAITRIEEVVVPVPADYLVTGVTESLVDAQRPWIDPYFTARGELLLSVHCFVVESLGTTIAVDTCAGVHEERRLIGDPLFLDRMAAAVDGGLHGVDVVVCTHLHFDHVGWNTVLDAERAWVPTFPNARYLVTDAELDGFVDDDGIASASITPLIDASRLDRVELDHRITSEVRLVPTPGHTPGHVSVLIESGGASAFITGDAAHSPIQFAHPDLASERFDRDPARSRRTRIEIISRYADSDTLVLGTHFAPPTGGVLRSVEPGRARFVQADGR